MALERPPARLAVTCESAVRQSTRCFFKLSVTTSEAPTRLGIGLGLCWAAFAPLPVGLLAIGGGPCAGPGNAAGSAILLGAGLGSVYLAGYGIFRAVRGIGAATRMMRVWAALSICGAGFAMLAGGAYLCIGVISLQAFLRP